ncbi:MAG: [protein-PII] uridylyltransferase [Acidimicrobiales bacterium]|nr:[protein-PII] uridylyltransferase [Acidimicrobiaceae bacterium]MDP6077648.1 [protein-PII] uridylyltransferase [Acidimicrobiales bacterium]HCV37047.1 [protein-PII] uridylyltransferase [Acidimicrobiaceae bacterium]HJO80049.1 [protein-PII] uridylyltransferase [Acidimicrobiales bacterium]
MTAATFSATDLLADGSLKGSAFCEALTSRTDQYLVDVFGAGDPPGETALVAVGGYGRRELCPGSDIDLILLSSPGVDISDFAQSLWYPLWDAGFKLGHQVGTVEQILDVASGDLDTATSLLAARHIAGDQDLATALVEGGRLQWMEKADENLAALITRVDERHGQYGEVAFLLESELKEGRGGLRDVHTLAWAEATKPVLHASEAAGLSDAFEVLLTVRVELHRVTGGRSDRLLLELQDEVAERLGHGDADRLMADVAAAAGAITWVGDGVYRRLRQEHSQKRVPLSVGLSDSEVRDLGSGLMMDGDRLYLGDGASIAEDPVLPLRVAAKAAAEGAYLDRLMLVSLVSDSPPMPEPWPVEARECLVALMSAGPDLIPVVEDLDQVGLFVRLIPEWEPCRHRPQRNAYHRFTVDRHLFETAAGAAVLCHTVERPDLLVVGALLHDIGKGYPGDHTDVGMGLVRTIAERMGYPDGDVDILVAMVQHHLLLPDIATRRDLDDSGTVLAVAESVENHCLLSLLAALTEADSLATGPSAWSSWKAELVGDLVARVDYVLTGGDMSDLVVGLFPSTEQRVLLEGGEEVIWGDGSTLTVVTTDRPGAFSKVAGVLALNGLDVLDASAHSEGGRALSVFKITAVFKQIPDWPHVVEQVERALTGRLAISARLGERSRIYSQPPTSARPATPRVTVDNEASALATVLEVSCPDGVGVLYRITRAFAELDLDIVSARVQTIGSDVVDAFYLRDGTGSKITDPDHLTEIELSVLRWVVVDF